MRYRLELVGEVLEELKLMEETLRYQFEGRAMTQAECESLSVYYTEDVNNRLKYYFNIMDDIASVYIGYRHGVIITVALGD
jgi:hypothetical protein